MEKLVCTWTRWSGAIVGAAVVAMATACSSGEPRQPASEIEQTASAPASTPTQFGPTLPAKAERDSIAGAKSFVSYFVDELNYAAASGDVVGIRSASSNCKSCEAFASLYERTYANGGYFRGFEWSILSSISTARDGYVDTFIRVKAKAGVLLRKNSEKPQRLGPENYEFRVTTRFVNGKWRVERMLTLA
jgi:hypothetical protein